MTFTCVNGQNPKAGGEGFDLNHGDRIAFGQSIFVFVQPSVGSVQDLLNSGQVSYDMARKEVAEGGAVGAAVVVGGRVPVQTELTPQE